MTHEGAISTGQAAAERFGKPFVVYRLPAWPDAVYGVIAVDRGLPNEAVQCGVLWPDESASRGEQREQGSLF